MKLMVFPTERRAMEEFRATAAAMGPNHIAKFISKELWGPGGEIIRFVGLSAMEQLDAIRGMSFTSIVCDPAVLPELQLALLPYSRS